MKHPFTESPAVYSKETRKTRGTNLSKKKTLCEANFDIHLADLVIDELETKAFKYQVKYLRKMKKSKNLTLKSWMKRVIIVYSYLPLLQGEIRLTEEYLIEEVNLEKILVR